MLEIAIPRPKVCPPLDLYRWITPPPFLKFWIRPCLNSIEFPHNKSDGFLAVRIFSLLKKTYCISIPISYRFSRDVLRPDTGIR